MSKSLSALGGKGAGVHNEAILTGGAGNFMSMAGGFARGDDRVDTTGLDKCAAHTPKCIREAGQGAKG